MAAGISRILMVIVVGGLVGAALGVFVVAPATEGLFGTAAAAPTEEPTWRDRAPPAVPAAPELRSPSDGAIVPTQRPTLEWAPCATDVPVVYALELSPDSNFTRLPAVASKMVKRVVGLDTTSFTLTEDVAPPPGVPVYWRVQCLDLYLQESAWSEAWSFIPLPEARANPSAGEIGVTLLLSP